MRNQSWSTVMSLLLFFVIIAPAHADGVVCQYNDYLGSFRPQAAVNDVQITEELAFVAYSQGVMIVDIIAPSSPQSIGFILGPANNIELADSLLFIAGASNGLMVYDISIPESPEIVGTFVTQSPATDVDIIGTTAFISTTDGLEAVDIKTPSEMVALGYLALEGFTTFVTATDSIVVVSGRGVSIIDATDPTNMSLLSVISATESCSRVVRDGNILYTTYQGWGQDHAMRIYDISDPTQPELLSNTITGSSPHDIELSGARAFVADGMGGLKVYDVSDPSEPILLTFYDSMPNVHAHHSIAQNITLINGLAILAGRQAASSGSGFAQIIDLSTLHNSPIITVLDAVEHALDIQIIDGILYVASDDDGFTIIDASDESSPQILSVLNLESPVKKIEVVGNTAYLLVGRFESTLYIVDISDVHNPTVVGKLEDELIINFAIFGSNAYIASADDGFKIVDISDQSNPVVTDTVATSGRCQFIDVDEHTIIVGNYAPNDVEFFYYDELVPPTRLSKRTPQSTPINIKIIDNTAYVCISGYRYPMVSYNINSLFNPIELAPFSEKAYVDFHIVDGNAYALTSANQTGYSQSLDKFHGSDPRTAQLVGSVDIGGWTIDIQSDRAYIAASGPISIIDLSDQCGPCRADFTNDGTLDSFDISAFITAFSISDPIADLNNDQRWNFFDVSEFLTAFAAGCP